MHLIIHTAQYEHTTQRHTSIIFYLSLFETSIHAKTQTQLQTLTTDQSIYTDDIHLVTARNNDFARFTQITQTERGTET